MIRIFVLHSGVQIVAKQVDFQNDTYMVEKPHIIQLYEGEDGQPKVNFTPFTYTLFGKTESKITNFHSDHLLYVDDANTEIADFYKHATTGIIQTTTKLIV